MRQRRRARAACVTDRHFRDGRRLQRNHGDRGGRLALRPAQWLPLLIHVHRLQHELVGGHLAESAGHQGALPAAGARQRSRRAAQSRFVKVERHQACADHRQSPRERVSTVQWAQYDRIHTILVNRKLSFIITFINTIGSAPFPACSTRPSKPYSTLPSVPYSTLPSVPHSPLPSMPRSPLPSMPRSPLPSMPYRPRRPCSTGRRRDRRCRRRRADASSSSGWVWRRAGWWWWRAGGRAWRSRSRTRSPRARPTSGARRTGSCKVHADVVTQDTGQIDTRQHTQLQHVSLGVTISQPRTQQRQQSNMRTGWGYSA